MRISERESFEVLVSTYFEGGVSKTKGISMHLLRPWSAAEAMASHAIMVRVLLQVSLYII